MPHVWILNHYAETPQYGAGTRHYNLGKYLLDFGWSSSVIASSVLHSNGCQRLSPKSRFALEDCDGVSFLILRTPAYTGNGLGRVFNMLVYGVRSLRGKYLKLLDRPSVIIGSSVHPIASLAGWYLARCYNIPFIFEVRDLWPQTLIDLGRLKENGFVSRAMRGLELFLYKRAARIITLMPYASNYIEEQGIIDDKVIWLSNGVNSVDFNVQSTKSESADESFVLMYFGAHGVANDLKTLLLAVSYLDKKFPDELKAVKFSLRLLGDGPLKQSLVRMVEGFELQYATISFENAVPKSDIPSIADEADAFVLTVLDRPNLYRYGISMNKLFDYMAASKPVVIASSAANNPVRDAGCGVSALPENPQSLAEGIVKLMKMSNSQRQRMGLSGRLHIEKNYDYRVLAERLSVVLDDVVSEYSAQP